VRYSTDTLELQFGAPRPLSLFANVFSSAPLCPVNFSSGAKAESAPFISLAMSKEKEREVHAAMAAADAMQRLDQQCRSQCLLSRFHRKR
jgi:hypothetical protein